MQSSPTPAVILHIGKLFDTRAYKGSISTQTIDKFRALCNPECRIDRFESQAWGETVSKPMFSPNHLLVYDAEDATYSKFLQYHAWLRQDVLPAGVHIHACRSCLYVLDPKVVLLDLVDSL
jgi:hypothetical protein